MGLYFSNATDSTAWIAYGYFSPGCQGTQWSKKGWYKASPGQTIKVLSGWAGNSSYFWYAESDSGLVWRGPYVTALPPRRFDWCWNTASTDARDLGLRIVQVSWEIMDHTIRLTR